MGKSCKACSRGGIVKVTEEGLCLSCRRPVPERPAYPDFDDLGADVPAFDEYFTAHVDIVRRVQAELAKSLDDDLSVMDSQVRTAEAYLNRMEVIRAWADSYLDVAEHQALREMPERSSFWTDLDRETSLRAAVNRQRRFRDVVKGMVRSIETRISYAQSRFKYIERNSA